MTHADELRLLATSLRDQFLTIASPIISAQYIQAEEDLLSLPGLPWHEHAVVATRLAQHLRAEFEKTRDVLKLRRAIALRRDLLAHAPPGHPDRSVTCAELAVLLGLHPRKSSDLNSLDEAIGLQEEALSLTPPEHPFRARVCSDLAESLRGRFRSTQSDAALEDAIRLDREALRLRPVGHPDRLLSCINLAMSLWVQHTNAPSSSVLGEIISLQREALALLPRHHPNRAQHCEALAESLIVHFRDTRDAAVLEEAISFVRQAIELTPTHQHRKQSFLHNKLASHLTWLYYHSSGHQYATEAVQLRRRSLHLHSATDRNRDRQCSELGHSLHMLSTRTGDYTLLIEAVSYHRECLALRPVGHSKRDQACANLAVALTSLANWLHDVAHIDEAVALGKEALTLSTVGHPRRAETCKVLVSALMARFRITGDTSAIDETVVLAREALLLNSHDDFKKSRACKDLAEALTNRFLQTHETTAVEEAIMLHHKALDIYPPDHPSRWRMLVSLVRIHTEPHYTARDPSLAMDYLSQAISFEVDNLPRLLQNVMISLDRIEAVGVPDELKCALLQIYEKAVELVIYLTGYALSGTMQLEHLAACRTLGPRAYTLAVSLGHVDTALQVLERTRGVVWAQLLHMRDPQLHDVPPEMASQLSSLFSQLLSHDAPVSDDFAGRTYLSQRDVRHQQHGRVQRLLKEIRALPGMDGFLRGITLEAMKAAAIHHPVVVLFAGAGGCSAIIMRDADSPLFLLPLPNIRLSDLESTMLSTSTSSMRGGPDTGDRTIMISEGRRRGALGLDRLLERLWTNVVRPVLMHLGCIPIEAKTRKRIHWCPTGAFGFAPIHAAGIYQGPDQDCATNYVVSSYTPTLAALIRAQRSVPSVLVPGSKLLIAGAQHAYDQRLPSLVNVGPEMDLIRRITSSTGVAVDSIAAAERGSMRASLQSSQWAHIACHGIQHPRAPLQSAFCLADGNLTVSDLMELKLDHAFFAFLSACETAREDEVQAGQVIHLAAAMLFVGFRSVVATMWAMKDADGPFVAKHFYERLFANKEITADSIPSALDYAVTELRKSGVSPERWATFIHMGA